MTAINETLQQPIAFALGWALLQFLWQGSLIALLTAALLAALHRSAADVRYVLSSVALSLMLTMPVVTVVQALRSAPAAAAPVVPLAVTEEEPQAPGAPRMAIVEQGTPALPTSAILAVERQSLERWLPLFLSAWLGGVSLLTLRLLSGWLFIQRMRSHRARPLGDALQGAALGLMRRLHIRRPVTFLESSVIDVPTVIGWLKPVVLLPASVLAGLSPRQVEAILAHELAHIRRHDYLVNLLQAVVETLLFYHPAVWWVSRRIRIERENCCDDLAVSLCGDPVAYAAALAELEGLRGAGGQLALAASGGSLLQRVRRVLGAPSHAGRAPAWLAAGLSILVVVSLSAGAAGTDVFLDTDQATTRISGDADDRPAAVPVVPVTPATAITSVPPVTSATPVVPDPPEVAEPVRVSTAASPASPPEGARAAAVVIATPPNVESTMVNPAIADAMAVTVAEPARGAPAVTITTPSPVISPALPVTGVAARADQAPVIASGPVTAIQRSSDGEKSGNYIWSDNGQKLEVSYRGDFAFNDDDTDVRSITPGGFLRIKDGGRFGTNNTIEFRAGGGDVIERRFWVGTAERPFDPEGRTWLAQVLPKFIRQSGIGAASRVARIFKSGGAAAVLSEISLVEGSWAKRLYFSELFKTPRLDSRTVQQVLAQAGRQIDSDFELASLLIASNAVVSDDATRKTYLDAARTIGSDFELRRVLSSVLKGGQVASPIAVSLLDASTSIDSDFEQASLLSQVAKLQPLDAAVRGTFFKALGTVQSDFEHRRVLTAVLQRGDLSPEARVQALESAALVTSDFEAASILLQFVKDNAVEGALRAPFFRAVSSIGSAFERGRVLQALAKRTDLGEDGVLDVVRSAEGISGHFEKAQVLLAVAGNHQLTREARSAYIDAAQSLGDLEQGRVLSALVKNERRKEPGGVR